MDDLDEFLYGDDQQEKPENGKAQTSSNAIERSGGGGDGGNRMDEGKTDGNLHESNSDDEEEDEESDDELEIVLDESGNDIQDQMGKEKRETLQLKPTGDGGEDQINAKDQVLDEVVALKGHINVNGIGEFEGKSILEIDIDAIDDKPWRKPGADITDYFNYGFGENTWRAYCIKQKQMREDATLKKMAFEMPDISSNQYTSKSRRDRSRSPMRPSSSHAPRRSREPSSESYTRRRESSRDRDGGYSRRRDDSRDKRRDYGGGSSGGGYRKGGRY